MDKCKINMSALKTTPTKRPEIEESAGGRESSAEVVGESVNVRELIFSFEQQSLREPEPVQKHQHPNDKKQSQFQSLNASRDSINHIDEGAAIKGMDEQCSPICVVLLRYMYYITLVLSTVFVLIKI